MSESPLDPHHTTVFMPSISTVTSACWSRNPNDRTMELHAEIRARLVVTDLAATSMYRSELTRVAEEHVRRALRSAAEGPIPVFGVPRT